MHPFPHRYAVEASGPADGDVVLGGAGLPDLSSAPPFEFDGPGDRWSPETLLVAAVADCFVLSFRAVARASKVSWTTVGCEAVGTLDRVDGVTAFTAFQLHAHLRVPSETDPERARRALEKAERVCLVANSLKAMPQLTMTIDVDAPQPALEPSEAA
jgi:organic hydroperoxide reductase OsmC/OhrA